MATSGSGTGTPVSSGVSPTTYPDAWPNCAVSLARYAQIIMYDEAAFWGVTYTNRSAYECTNFWTEYQRNAVADALAQAQAMIEDVVGFPLCPTWITGTYDADLDGRYVDQQAAIGNPVTTKWGYVIQAGVMAESTIRANASIDYTDSDTSVVGPIATSVTDTNEIKVFYPGSERIITPSRVTISGGNLTIQIPRCRLVNPDLLDNTGDVQGGLEKTDTDNFLSAVDVKRIYNDPATNASLVRDHVCDALCSSDGCVLASDAACMVIKDPMLGILHVHPGAYANSAWSVQSTGYCYNHVRLNYQAGLRTLNRNVESVIVRLAHAVMSEEPCGCSVTQRLWQRDRRIPEGLDSQATSQRFGNPFGLTDGAHFAYLWAQQNALGRGGVL